jgi:inhibitor of KinA sporulation pathway (predicted exonuclease)
MKISSIINVVDIEATCWDNEEERKGQPNETIEIGITEVDLFDLKIYRNDGIYILPDNSLVSEFCTKLTGITPVKIASDGITFENAARLLKTKFRIHKRHWVSWGDYDKGQLQRDCDRHNLEYHKVFFKRHTNLKTVFAMLHGLPRELSVDAALRHVGLNFKGSQHSGKDDAYNIAMLYIHTMQKFRK